MLYLAPPFYIINRVSVFRDHEDPLQWYYLPGPPRLTQGTDGASLPRIQIVEFRGAAGSGGFLNFDVNLGVDPNVLDEIRDEIKRSERLRETPRLSPVPLLDGTVRMMLFDRQSGDAGDGTGEAGLKFALRLDHNAQPSLYGDNQAAFSVRLSQEGVVALRKALSGEMSPIGVIYSLDYLALRPAYSVRLTIDWDRVQKHLDETFGTDSIFFQSQITKAVDELIENRAIVLEDDLFVPEGEDEMLMGRHEQAVEEVREMIADAFFSPSLNPIEPEKEDTWDKLEHLAKTNAALAATGGWGALIGFTYRRIDYTRIDRKRLNVNIRERTAVKKSVFPQGHLSGLLQALRRPGVDPGSFIVPVDLDDPWFAKRRLQLIPRADFKEDGIVSIQVSLNYGGLRKTVVLDASSGAVDAEWSSLLEGGAMMREVAVRYKVNFRPSDGGERPLSLESPETVETGDIVEIHPRELYTIVPVPIQALNFPWERYSHVEVRTQYADPAHGIRQTDTFLLKAEHATEAVWPMFVLDPDNTRFQYKRIYRAVDHRDVETPWLETDEELLTIRDPFPAKRTLEIVPVFDWTKIDRAFVDVAYEDPANGIIEQASFEFNDKAADTGRFTVALEDPSRRQVGYKVTVVGKDGTVTETPQSFTLQPRIAVRSDMKGHKIVAIRPEPGDFAAQNIRDIVVKAEYADPDRGLSYADEFTFKSASDRAFFEYDFAGGGPVSYRYRIVRRYANGLSNTTDWRTGGQDELLVPLK